MDDTTIWVLLKGADRRGYALYENGVLVANYSHRDYRWYIDDQIEMRAGADAELIERDHAGPFPEELPNKGVKQERLKSRDHKTQAEIDAEAVEPKAKPRAKAEPTPGVVLEDIDAIVATAQDS
jgi:hypothetical protein